MICTFSILKTHSFPNPKSKPTLLLGTFLTDEYIFETALFLTNLSAKYTAKKKKANSNKFNRNIFFILTCKY